MNPPLPLLPVPLLRLVGLVLFAESAYFIAWYSRISLRAARRVDISSPSLRSGAWGVGVVLALALSVSLVIGDGAHFPLANEAQRRLWSALPLLAFFVPGLLWAFFSRTGKALLPAIEPDTLIRVQAYRMAGAMFLFPFLALHALPAEFALPAGIGDVLTGLMAPFVARAIEERRPGAYRRALLWNLFGIADLVVAVGTALHSQAQILAIYPLCLVPLFLGPPMGLLTHALSLRSLALHREEIEGESRQTAPADRSTPLPAR